MAASLDCRSLAKMERKKLKKMKLSITHGEMETEAAVSEPNYKNYANTSTRITTQQYEKKVNQNITNVGVSEESGVGISDQGKQKNKKKKKRGKTKSIVEGKPRQKQQSKEGEVEDVAESVDSGCIADIPLEIVGNLTDWPQVGTVLLEEDKFVSSLLMWVPLPKEDQDEAGEKGGEKRKAEGGNYPNSKREKADDPVIGELRAIYERNLAKLRKGRGSGKRKKVAIKQEKKISKKIRTLNLGINDKIQQKRNLKTLAQLKLKTEKIDKKDIGTNPPKPVYNNQGDLVFSKFDFSSNTGEDLDTKAKPKDLKQLLAQALKEKEKAKWLEQKGKTEAAVNVVEQRAWSSVLKKAEGVKVRDNVNLLKRTIKKQELRKKKSQKKWEERQQRQEKQITSKDAARKKNLVARKDVKLNKKMGKMKKKGHVVPVPGF